ncbi:MAG: universal stress protein, partial [Actinomycetota bacterium]|nr:universal stress protein [Actinomycetota bacterium]
PALVVRTAFAAGPPGAVLRAAAEDADLLVVGADDASPFTEAIVGSVPGDLLTTAPCPLAVVPRREWTTPASAPVVVAVDDQGTSTAALAYAFAAASRSGRPLTLLRCLPPGAHAGHDRVLIGFDELYSGVDVATETAVVTSPRHWWRCRGPRRRWCWGRGAQPVGRTPVMANRSTSVTCPPVDATTVMAAPVAPR